MSKVPHRKIFVEWGWDYKPVELTGKCKRVTYPGGSPYEYVQCQRRIFGIKCGTFWLNKDFIRWADPKKVEYYDCECINEKDE
jgi:hypothetical protein